MRQGPTQKRGRGRSGGRRGYSGSSNRTFDSNGPDVKVRGTAMHIFDKYQVLARDATAAGDRVAAENYLQHAEHYFRIMNAHNAANAANQQGGIQHSGAADDGANGRARSNGAHLDTGPDDDTSEPVSPAAASKQPDGNGSTAPAADGGADDEAGKTSA